MKLRREVFTHHVANATEATNQAMFTSLPGELWRLKAVRSRHRVASTSGTLQIAKAASGTAFASGTNMLSATMSLSGAGETNVSGTLSASGDVIVFGDGQSIGTVFAGTLTGLLDLTITYYLEKIR